MNSHPVISIYNEPVELAKHGCCSKQTMCRQVWALLWCAPSSSGMSVIIAHYYRVYIHVGQVENTVSQALQLLMRLPDNRQQTTDISSICVTCKDSLKHTHTADSIDASWRRTLCTMLQQTHTHRSDSFQASAAILPDAGTTSDLLLFGQRLLRPSVDSQILKGQKTADSGFETNFRPLYPTSRLWQQYQP
jgi:hypothetical protein